MRLITNDDSLRKFWPNAMVTVKGEASLFDKIAGHLMVAEEWLCNTFLSDKVMTRIVQEPLRGSLHDLASRIVVAHAMIQAVPTLDLVLTPNGFGVVNTTTIAPASKERVERLLESLESQRDDDIELLLPILFALPEWKCSIQKEFFSASLFPNLDLPSLCGFKVHRWKQYMGLRYRAMSIEQELADSYVSPDLIRVLRTRFADNSASESQLAVIMRLRAIVILRLTGKDQDISDQSYYDIVNVLRNNPQDFPEWHSSSTAQLYAPVVFRNKKEAKGYWF